MDKIISARIDQGVAYQIDALARQLGCSKKKVLEEAIRLYAMNQKGAGKNDVFDRTFGAWRRPESAEELVKTARHRFRRSLTKHQQ